MTPSAPARRGLLATAALVLPLLATGCKGLAVLGNPPPPAPGVAALDEAMAGERLMIARYRAVLAASPALQASLGGLLAEHEAHLAAFGARLVLPRPELASSPAASPPGVPASAPAALAYLRQAERDAAAALLSHLGVAPPSLAQLLASVAASELSHAAVLGRRRR